MKGLTTIEIQFLLRLVVQSDAYNDGGRVAGDVVSKLEEEIQMRLATLRIPEVQR